MVTLLRVETAFVSVEFQGHLGPPPALAALGGLSRPAHLRVESSDGSFEARAIDGSTLDLAVDGPAFFEEAAYWIVVESAVAGSPPIVTQRDPTVVTRQNVLRDRSIVTLTAVYRRQVGLSEWRFQVGEEVLTVELEVFPSKLDYDLDYEALVTDITNVKRALALEYFRSTHRLGSLDRTQPGETVEWISILRTMIADLGRAMLQINRSPQRGLRYERQLTPLHQIRGATPSVVRSVARRQGVGPLVDMVGVGKAHSLLPVMRTDDTLDTFEHRWLRSRLRNVHRRLLALEAEQNIRIGRATRGGGNPPARLAAELAEVRQMTVSVGQLLELPVMAAATAEVPAAYVSLQLQSALGYGEAYQILSSLNSALGLVGESQPYSLSDLNELYEIWCFLKVVQLVAIMTTAELDLSAVLATSRSGLRFNLAKGARSSVTLRNASSTVSIVYNEEFRMPTGVQKPDIVVHVRRQGVPDKSIVLDAKYRLDASEEYVRQFGAVGAPVDAVNALHRYRDAIQPKVGGKRLRAISAGVALFPWHSDIDPDLYSLRRSLDEVGIGALPFLPGNESAVGGWLTGQLRSVAGALPE